LSGRFRLSARGILSTQTRWFAAEFVDREVGATCLDPAVRRLVESLAKRHQFGVLTNGDGYMQRRKLEEHGLDDLADAVVISNEVGVRKPNPQIFETADGAAPGGVVPLRGRHLRGGYRARTGSYWVRDETSSSGG